MLELLNKLLQSTYAVRRTTTSFYSSYTCAAFEQVSRFDDVAIYVTNTGDP